MAFISPKDQLYNNHLIQVVTTLLGVSVILFNNIHYVHTVVMKKIQVSWNCVAH
jgi:hypothetical protein